jgi:hypothetical protein
MLRSFTICLLMAVISLPHVCVAKDSRIEIEINPNLDQSTMMAWLTYLGARQAFHEQHKLPVPRSGEVIPSFAEEVSARTTGLEMYSAMGLHDSYWDVLAKVNAKGFMKAYVWNFLHRPEWKPEERPANLPAFQQWARSALPHHKPQTGGRLVIKR